MGEPTADAGDSLAPDASFADAPDDLPVPDAAMPDGAAPDVGQTADAPAPDADAAPACPDQDRDGHLAMSCGGDDCEDGEPLRHPGLAEGCDFYDNDCNGHLNDGVTCSFFAQTGSQLYEVDPFRGTARVITSVPGLWDVDTHPDGTLYGISDEGLYRLQEADGSWTRVGDLAPIEGQPNGLGIDLDGRAYVTSGNTLYTVDLASGDTTQVGGMGGGFISSGDCVVNKDNTLYMSSLYTDDSDLLIRINGDSGVGVVVGPIGFHHIFGLTAAWGYLFGLSSSGDLVSIDELTGQGRLLATFTDSHWYGAASTPSR